MSLSLGAVPSAWDSRSNSASAGSAASAPQLLSSGANVFDALGEGFTLLALDAPQSAVTQFGSAAEALNIPLKIVADSRPDLRASYKASIVLVRPDQFVAWASNDMTENPIGVLSRVTGKT
jgi:4-hydroxyisophthalate hydroxylase